MRYFINDQNFTPAPPVGLVLEASQFVALINVVSVLHQMPGVPSGARQRFVVPDSGHRAHHDTGVTGGHCALEGWVAENKGALCCHQLLRNLL